jgi:hypothetical protein
MEQNNVRSQQLFSPSNLKQKKKKKKKDVANCPALLAIKSKKQQQKQFHQYSDRRLSVMCMCAQNSACCGC